MAEFEKIPEITSWLGAGSINAFGVPFSGKDSQLRRLAKTLEGVHLSGGTILRNSDIPADIKAIMKQGLLIPTPDFVQIVLPYLSQAEFDGKPLLLSSVGRWEGEQEGVLEALETSGHPTKAVIYLNLEDSLARQRLEESLLEEELHEDSRGERDDDDHEHLTERLREFHEKTMPVIDYYRERGLLIEVDASLEKHEVENKIMNELAARALRA